MTIEEIRKGAPDKKANHYIELDDSVQYLKIDGKGVMVWKDYDVTSNWFYASPTSVLYYKDKIKPLY